MVKISLSLWRQGRSEGEEKRERGNLGMVGEGEEGVLTGEEEAGGEAGKRKMGFDE